MKLNRTVVAAIVLHSASVYISRKVEHAMTYGSIQEDIRFVNLSRAWHVSFQLSAAGIVLVQVDLIMQKMKAACYFWKSASSVKTTGHKNPQEYDILACLR